MTGRHPGLYDQPPGVNRFERGREISAQLKQTAYSAADRQHVETMQTADAALKAADPGDEPLRSHERAYAASSDALADAYARAEQQHNDRLAALALHFGEKPHASGNPFAPHIADFMESQSLRGFPSAAPAPDIKPNMVEIAFGGISTMRHLDGGGRPMPAPNTPDPERGTFGDAADQARWAADPTAHAREVDAAKRAAVTVPSPAGTAPGATQGMKSRSRADTRAAELLKDGKPIFIQASPGWQDTKH